MSLTYGFYNSKDHDRMYDAVQLSMLFDGLINDGVYATIGKKVGSNERVTPFYMTSLGSGNRITIGPGRAWFRHTWSYNDADVVIRLPDPPYGTNKKRYDAIVLDINAGHDVRANSFAVISGTEKITSSDTNIPYPTLENTETRLQVPLAYVLRRNSDSAISDADITSCIGDATLGCPYVTGVISYISIEQLLRQAATDWNNFKGTANQWYTEFTTGFEADANEWYTNFTSGLEEYATNFETNYVNDFTNWSTVQKNEFISWMTGEKNDFDTWFANIQYILDGDVAGHLQNEIDALSNRVVPIEKGGTGNTHGHIQSGHKNTSDYNKGEFATAEGMNTAASGKCAHAEGAGNYTYSYQDAHLEGDMLLGTGENSSYSKHFVCTWTSELTGDNSAYQIGPARLQALSESTIYDKDDNNLTGNNTNKIKSLYFSAILTNETTGEILKGEAGCIGPSSMNEPGYVGHIPNITDFTSHKEFIDQDANGFTPIDIGGLGSVYSMGYGRFVDPDTMFRTSYELEEDYNIQGSGSFRAKYSSWTPKSFAVTDRVGTFVYYKANLEPKDESGNVVVNIDTLIPSKYNGNTYYRMQATITFHYSYDSSTSKYVFDGDVDYTYNRNDDNNTYLKVGFWDSYQDNVTPYSGGGLPYWYMDGDTPETSSVLVPGCFGAQLSEYPFSAYTHRTAYFTYNPVIGGAYEYDRIISSSSFQTLVESTVPTIILKNKTDKYSLKFYYSYALESETDIDSRPITFHPAGESLTWSGQPTRAIGNYSHAEGYKTKAYGDYSHAEGSARDTYVDDSKNPGAYGIASHVEGTSTRANGTGSHAEGEDTLARGDWSHAEGYNTKAYGKYAHAEGSNTVSGLEDASIIDEGYYAHAEGNTTVASGRSSHSEGENTTASGDYSHVEGYNTSATKRSAHAEGYSTAASEDSSHAEGYNTIASGKYSHAEGKDSQALNESAHAEGYGSKAYGLYSHAGGGGIADLANQFVHGCFGFVGKPIVHESASGESTMALEHTNIFNGINLIYPPSSGTYTLNIAMMTNDTEYKQCHAWLAILKEYGSTSYNDIGVYLIHVPDINSAGSPKIEQIYKSGDIVHTLSGNTGYKLVFNKASSAGAALQIYRIM